MAVAALRRRVGARLENVTVASAHHQLRPVDADLDTASLARMRRVLWIVTQTVLTSQFFSHRAKRDIKILLPGVIKTRASHAGQVMQILIGALILTPAVS